MTDFRWTSLHTVSNY